MVQQQSPPWYEKIGIKYYSPSIMNLVSIYIYQITFNIQSLLLGRIFLYAAGYYISFGRDEGQKYTKYHNSHIYHVFPLIFNCFVSFIIIMHSWYRYEQICVSVFSTLLFSFLFSLSIGINIDACHQLIHRNQKIAKTIGFVSLMIHQFTTYPIEHLYIHHKNVGTQKDPITAAKNTNFFKYYFRAIYSSYKANYDYSKSVFILCIVLNLTYIGLLAMAALYQGLSQQAAIKKVAFFVMLSYLNIVLAQMIQYVQHYGLIVRKIDTPITETCSWNSQFNDLLNFNFKFQSHSDHHMNSHKIYSSLALTKKMPKFPFDFFTGFLLMLVPSIWFKVANPLVDEVVEGKAVTESHYRFIFVICNIVRIIALGLTLLFLINSLV